MMIGVLLSDHDKLSVPCEKVHEKTSNDEHNISILKWEVV